MGFKFPRASNGNPIAIGAKLWGRIIDEIERLGKFSVAPPLEFIDHPGGRLLRVKISPAAPSVLVRPTSAAAGRGIYAGVVVAPPSAQVDPAVDYSPSFASPLPFLPLPGLDFDGTDFDGTPARECYIVNLRELSLNADAGSHMLDLVAGSPSDFFAIPWGAAPDGKPVYLMNDMQDGIGCPTGE